MPHINLLPWRETLRKEREIRLAMITGVALALTGGIWLGVHTYMESVIDYQKDRNAYLEREIKEVEKKIKEIEQLENQKKRLIDRMNTIQNLSANRPRVVHLFAELVNRTPPGVYFTSLKQDNDKIMLEGVAQSDARVSSLMTSIEPAGGVDKANQWLVNPEVRIIEAKQIDVKGEKNKRSVSNFKMDVKLITPKSDKDKPIK